MATTALLPTPQLQFCDSSGNPLVGGSLYTYIVGTTTNKTTWLDANQSAANTNPIRLDAAGRCNLYGSGTYRLILKDVLGNTIFDQVSQAPTPDSIVSAAMTPVVQAATVSSAANLLGVSVSMQAVTSQATTGEAMATLGTVYPVATVAALRALTGNPQNIYTRGYASDTDGGEGYWSYQPADTTSVDNIGTIVVTALGKRYFRQLGKRPVTPQMFGAKGDGVTDDFTAVQACLTFGTTAGYPIHFPKGTYKCNSQLNVVLDAILTTGITIEGDGVNQSIIDVQAVASTPQFYIHGSADNDYLVLRGIGIWGRSTGVTFQLGKDDYSDPVNEPELDLVVLNFDATATARAVVLNYVLNGDIRLVANTGGPGTGLTCRQCSFCYFYGSFGALLGKSVWMRDGFNVGNVFVAADFENVLNCVVIDGSNCVQNSFLGGTWSYATGGAGIFASAGSSNYIFNPNLNPVAPATTAQFVGGSTGIVVIGASFPAVTTPAVPATTVAVTNTTGFSVQVAIWGGAVTSVSINGGTPRLLSAGTFILANGDTITLVHAGAPNWIWTQLK